MADVFKDMTDRFNTKLSPIEEAIYNMWVLKRSAEQGRNVEKDLYDYDLRGAYKNLGPQGTPHLPDTFKKPNHPTFSDQSQYSTPLTPGGTWGENSYIPSDFVLFNHGPEELQRYFNKVEPGVDLILKNRHNK